VLSDLSRYTAGFGKRFLVVASQSGIGRFGDKIKKAYEGTGCEVLFEKFGGECTKKEAKRIAQIVMDKGCDAVVGLGGGKVMDAAKGVAYEAGGVTTIIIPTVAASDAPTSALSVYYDEDGVLDEVVIFNKNPEVVLVDTKVIAEAPTRLFVAGMGDALATYFEARGCIEGYKENFVGGVFTQSSAALAELCYKLLLENGALAIEAVNANKCTKAVENIIEANTLLSGLGFESNGVTGAHSVYYGFTVLPEHLQMYHGEFVAFGTIVLLVLENRSKAELEEVIRFCISVGLPVCFDDLRLGDLTPEKLDRVAAKALAPVETIHNEPFDISKDELIGALLTADALGRAFKKDLCK
jgi:glycerol dehydrogenase